MWDGPEVLRASPGLPDRVRVTYTTEAAVPVERTVILNSPRVIANSLFGITAERERRFEDIEYPARRVIAVPLPTIIQIERKQKDGGKTAAMVVGLLGLLSALAAAFAASDFPLSGGGGWFSG